MEETKAKKYEIDMCQGPILKKMLLFAIPLMCSSILQLLFNAADIVVVGRFAGDNALAAVGANGSVINLMVNLFVGMSVGANVLAAHCYGARQEQELSETVHTAMSLSLISGVILTLAGVFGARQILIWMNTPDELLDLAALYLRIYFGGITATMIYNFGSALLRAVGDTRRPLYYLLAAGVINVVLNLYFVICLQMDVAGVGIATVISQCVSAFLVVRCLMKEQGGIQLHLKELRIYPSKLVRILKVGLPAGLQGTIFSLSNVVIQSSVNTFGATVVAGASASANIENFIYVAMNSFYQSTISFTSQNMGAGEYKRTRIVLRNGLLCVVVTALALGGITILFGKQLLGIYSTSGPVIEAGMQRLKIFACFYAFCGMMDVMVGAMRGLGQSILPMIVSLLGACGLRLLWVGTVFQMEQFHTIQGLYIAYPISWLITFLAHVGCYFMVRHHLEKKLGISFKS